MKNLIIPITISVCLLIATGYIAAQTSYSNTKLAAVQSTQPVGSDMLSSGDDEIRALKAALLDWADDEHLLTGAHATNFFRQYMAGTNSIAVHSISNLTITTSNLATSIQRPLIYLTSIETDGTSFGNTSNTVTLAQLVCPSNTYSKIMIEAEVDYADSESSEACVFNYYFVEGVSTTNNSFRTQTPSNSQTKGVMRISTIFNGGQSVATTNTLYARMTQKNTDHVTFAKNMRLWGIP